METENRMKEIAGNLKRDVKDLLGESANIVAGFFKRGLSTVRGAVDRWKNFTQGISSAVGTLFKPFENALPPALSPEQEPMVTVMESNDPELPVGARMTLYEAETRVEQLNKERWDSDKEPSPVTVAIDYTLEGEQDRYWLPLSVGAGGRPMLEQMEGYVTSCLKHPDTVTQDFYAAPEGLAELLHEQFGPQLHSDLSKLATKVIGHFRQHCNISRLEQQFEVQSQAMPEKEREKFKRSMSETITTLRRAANTGQVQSVPRREQEQPDQSQPAARREKEQPDQPQPAALTAPPEQPSQKAGQKTRRSVKMKLQEIKEGQPTASTPHKARTNPQR